MKTRGGLSLLELLVVLAVVGTLLAVGLTALGRWRASASVQQGGAQLARLVTEARVGARGTNTCWQLSVAGREVTLRRFGTPVCTLTGGEVVRREALPDGVGIELTGGSDPMRFVPPYGTTDGSPNEYTLRWERDPTHRQVARVTGVFARVVLR